MQLFSERLRLRRTRLNLTQPELAEKSGVSMRSIVAYEGGDTTPTLKQAQKLAAALLHFVIDRAAGLVVKSPPGRGR